MKKKIKPIPEPVHVIPITFKAYGRSYSLRAKIFKNNQQVNQYYESVVVPHRVDPNGIYAGAIFDTPDTENKNCIGEMIFSLQHMWSSLIAHEAIHLVFNYYQHTHGLNFTNRRREESFCGIHEDIMNAMHQYLNKNKIPYRTVGISRN